MIRLTICMSYRSRSEVLLHDSGPLLSVDDARSAFEAIADALDGNANQITDGWRAAGSPDRVAVL